MKRTGTSSGHGKSAKTKARRRQTQDPRGGLTAAGRAEFRRREGAHLKLGVKKAVRDMTPAEMKRKGSWQSGRPSK